MTDKERYRQLKIENDQRVAGLVDSYHFIAHTYVLKARGYAKASLDTEARIKDVLDELYDFCDRGLLAPMAIPNTTEYIEGKIKILAKKSNRGEKVKGIIWTTVLFVFIGAVVVFGLILRTNNVLDKPSNISCKSDGNSIIIEWDKVDLASSGYSIYYIDANGKEYSDRLVEQGGKEQERITYVFEGLDPNQEYTFYICSNIVQAADKETTYYFPSDYAEYKYVPKVENNE